MNVETVIQDLLKTYSAESLLVALQEEIRKRKAVEDVEEIKQDREALGHHFWID